MTRIEARALATFEFSEMAKDASTPELREMLRGKSRDEIAAALERSVERRTIELMKYKTYSEALIAGAKG